MSQPRVCAVMLVDGRPEMVYRAVESFGRQTYANAYLLAYDSGTPAYPLIDYHHPSLDSRHVETTRLVNDTIGSLRNRANCHTDGDIIVHWDSDDWSAPERIAEQVALLQTNKHEAVGYSDMLFWDTRVNEAWLYTGSPRYMLGTSLCYWRNAWKRKPFPAVNQGEDTQWQMGLQSYSVTSGKLIDVGFGATDRAPRMVCSIHGDNISSHVDQRSTQWRRLPKWDEHCKQVMA